MAGVLVPIAKTEAEKQEAKLWLEKALAQDEPYAYTVAGVLYSEKIMFSPLMRKKLMNIIRKLPNLVKKNHKLFWPHGIGKDGMYQKTR